MAQIIHLAAQGLLTEPLPPLRVGQNHTDSSAIHKIDFVGQLMPWPNFEREVIRAFSSPNIHWSNDTPDVRIVGAGARNSISEEQLVLGDENGVQGRLNERLGRPVAAAFQAQHHRLRMADFKASAPAAAGYQRVPDFVILEETSVVKVVGEAKAPWPSQHLNILSIGVEDFESGQDYIIRRTLGQVARYMRELDIKHAFLSTYDETIFLRKVDIRGYSPVIAYDDQYAPQLGDITTRQGLFYLALLGQSDPAFTGSTGIARRNKNWTVSRENQ
ncbi:uncharacterized protein N7525_005228 [Penicillium rubens]|uniref:uncharacterized protein n=1 Tax=Penicillium rubens TaxID=1108849 RepID=UPI002A5A7415|nr:uncharacterized protein N7525_005228 [Penicillium rubens]KAJ5840040.1 hypothetical protein N7525_005228 [Penicillium rubens]